MFYVFWIIEDVLWKQIKHASKLLDSVNLLCVGLKIGSVTK